MKRRRSIFAPPEEMPVEVAVTKGLEPADHSALPDELAQRGELRSAIEEAIRGLSPLYRAVVLLRDVEELTTEQTAEILDVSTDVVKQRLHRARIAMREQLAPVINIAEVMR
jgi:RNA polymerase sigma-70 factor (ECF subfamily)